MRIAIIGTGAVGLALGRGWSRAGHAIIYGVADPADPRHAKVAAETKARLASTGEAAAGAEAIVLAVPWRAVGDVAATMGPVRGKLVIDATNPLQMGEHGLELALGFDSSGGEAVAALLPEARVVKTMNQVGYSVMDAAAGYPAKPTMFVVGDDERARAEAMALVGDLGFAPLDAGPMRLARLLEPYAMLWIHMALNRGAPATGAFALMQKAGAAS